MYPILIRVDSTLQNLPTLQNENVPRTNTHTQAHVHSRDILIKFTGGIFLSSNNTKHIYDGTLIILSKYSILNMDIAGSNRPLKIFLFPFSITLVFLSFFDDLKKRKFSFTKVKHKELM